MNRQSAMDGDTSLSLRCLGGLLTLLAVTCTAFGQAAAEPASPASGQASIVSTAVAPYENISLAKSSAGKASGGNGASARVDSGLSIWRLIGSLAIVLAAIFLMRWGGKRLLNLTPTNSGSGAVQILSRLSVAPRQQLMLVKVGRHVVLVGNCGSQMNSLCQISDPDEVAGLLGELRQRPAATANPFLSFFGRAGSQYEPSVPLVSAQAGDERAGDSEEPTTPELRSTAGELDGLMAKVRVLSGAFKRS